jgi:hypothetical protein
MGLKGKMDVSKLAKIQTFKNDITPVPSTPRSGTDVLPEGTALTSSSSAASTSIIRAYIGSESAQNSSKFKRSVTDSMLGGSIPNFGFVLRTVIGGDTQGGGTVCSRCSWLTGCQGCLIPDDDQMVINLIVFFYYYYFVDCLFNILYCRY